MNHDNQPPHSIEAEQSVIGAILLDNDALERISGLKAEHFYRAEHRAIFAEIVLQVTSGKTCDVVSMFEPLRDRVEDCLVYLNQIAQNTPSSANIGRYAAIVLEKATKRSLIALGSELQDEATTSPEDSAVIVDRLASKVEAIAQKRTKSNPIRMAESLMAYAEVLENRMNGLIKPIQTGFTDLDRLLGGGFERGTLTVIAARPAMGKTAMGLALARNVSEWGSATFLSMEMDYRQVNDRNIAALGEIPLAWLRRPNEREVDNWNRLTNACAKAESMNLFIDDQTALTMLDIRNKARFVKRRNGLDMLVIDQLSFITGGGKDKKTYEQVGEYTRGMIALAKQLDISVVLLCQLSREVENRNNKRPQLSDLAMSGSIEQDADTVIFLYRDEVYNPDSQDKGICEVIVAKQRQGATGHVGLAYFGDQTRFANLAQGWIPRKPEESKRRGLAANL